MPRPGRVIGVGDRMMMIGQYWPAESFVHAMDPRVNNKIPVFKESYDDGVEQIDLNTIYLEGSGVEVNFSEVLLGKQEETRKLIVSTQKATVSTELSDRLIQKLD